MKYSRISLIDFSYPNNIKAFRPYLLLIEAPMILTSKQQF